MSESVFLVDDDIGVCLYLGGLGWGVSAGGSRVREYVGEDTRGGVPGDVTTQAAMLFIAQSASPRVVKENSEDEVYLETEYLEIGGDEIGDVPIEEFINGRVVLGELRESVRKQRELKKNLG